MCNDWFKEFKGWCKSFTRTEILLAILEAILLIICIGFLIFMILHFLVCFHKDSSDLEGTSITTTSLLTTTQTTTWRPSGKQHVKIIINKGIFITDKKRKIVINKGITTKEPNRKIVINRETTQIDEDSAIGDASSGSTSGGQNDDDIDEETLKDVSQPPFGPTHTSTPVSPDAECTWQPSRKTVALTHYYQLQTPTIAAPRFVMRKKTDEPSVRRMGAHDDDAVEDEGRAAPELEALAYDDQSDGEESHQFYKAFVLALVKPRPAREVQFGCMLTAVTAHWTLTAASCVDAVEEVDSLDSFVMMEGYGELQPGATYAVADVRVHPMYAGANRSHDLAALRSELRLRRVVAPARLPTLVEYFAVTAAERFTILGYGGFRRVASGGERALREVHVYALPSRQCPAANGDVWALRHLTRVSEGDTGGAAGAGPLCAGVLYARGAPCGYCAGTPLLRQATLLGVMSDHAACALACEPALYVNVAAVRDWIVSVLDPE